MKRRIIIASGLLVLLIIATPLALQLLDPPSPMLSSEPDMVPLIGVENFTNPDDQGVSLLLVTENETGNGLEARPVDPITLAEFPGYPPISFGHTYAYAISPDQRILAVVIWPGESSRKGVLHLVDLHTWINTPIDLSFNTVISDLVFSPDGKTLFWADSTGLNPETLLPFDYQLYSYDIPSGAVTTIAQLTSPLVPWSLGMAADRLTVWGVPLDANYMAAGLPEVLVFNPLTSQKVGVVQIDDVKVGQVYEQVEGVKNLDLETSGGYMNYYPGLAWDVEHGQLYIVSADAAQVSVIDLVQGALIKQTPIADLASFWEQWISTALAKGGPERSVQSQISQNGERLYILNQLFEKGVLTNGQLRTVAVDKMQETARLEAPLTGFALTPDGKSLLVIKNESVSQNGADQALNQDIYVLDAETLKESIHLRIDQADQLRLDGFSPDGRYAYVLGSSAQWVEGSGWRNWETTRQVLDLVALRLSPGIKNKGSFGDLIPLVP